MNIDIFIKLLVAHFLSDFVLQCNKLCQLKRFSLCRKSRFFLISCIAHVIHSFIHTAIAYLCVFQFSIWIPFVLLFFIHFIIDIIKSCFKKSNMLSFIIDQFFHVFSLLILWLVFFSDNYKNIDSFFSLCSNYLCDYKIWSCILAYILILKPTSVFLSIFMKQWSSNISKCESSNASLCNAGKMIGYCERILIVTFILMDNVSAIGFLLAAKSIFRFGELNSNADIKKTEYVLIGTFSSFTIAVLIGYILVSIRA